MKRHPPVPLAGPTLRLSSNIHIHRLSLHSAPGSIRMYFSLETSFVVVHPCFCFMQPVPYRPLIPMFTPPPMSKRLRSYFSRNQTIIPHPLSKTPPAQIPMNKNGPASRTRDGTGRDRDRESRSQCKPMYWVPVGRQAVTSVQRHLYTFSPSLVEAYVATLTSSRRKDTIKVKSEK